ncbi:hypothetical protein SO802_028548 [Lithocarpus litseifolius]|uniref:Uncharacterized protein n=1 Tax=Lithocarpus litseifolius TaxID=425828 RepID=A0AAW2BU66_9ROSI
MFLLFFHVDSGIEMEIGALQLEVLDEIGVDVASQLSVAPKERIALKRTDAAGRKHCNIVYEGLIVVGSLTALLAVSAMAFIAYIITMKFLVTPEFQ